jgi:hypothetical protein
MPHNGALCTGSTGYLWDRYRDCDAGYSQPRPGTAPACTIIRFWERKL